MKGGEGHETDLNLVEEALINNIQFASFDLEISIFTLQHDFYSVFLT